MRRDCILIPLAATPLPAVRRCLLALLLPGVSCLQRTPVPVLGAASAFPSLRPPGARCFHRSAPRMVEGHSVHRVAAAHRQRLVGKSFKATSPNGRFTAGAAAIVRERSAPRARRLPRSGVCMRVCLRVRVHVLEVSA